MSTENIQTEEQETANEIALIPQDNSTVDIVRKDDLKSLNEAVEKLKVFKRKYSLKKITVTDIDSKEQNEKLRVAIADVRTLKTGLEKDKKEKTKPYRDTVTFFNSNYDKVIEVAESLLEPLKDHKKEIADQIEARDKAEELKLQQRVTDRVQKLLEIGATFNDGYYQAGGEYDIPVIALGIIDIQTATDQIFDNIIEQIKEKVLLHDAKHAEAEAEQKRLHEEAEKIRLEEKVKFDKEQAELKAQREAFEKEQEDFKRQMQELKEQQEKLAKEKELAEQKEKQEKAAQEEKLWRGRLGELVDIGWNGQYAFDTHYGNEPVFSYEELISITDEEFSIRRDIYNNIITSRKEQKRIKDLQEIETRKALEAKLEKEKQERIVAKAIEDKRIADELAEKQRLEALDAASDADKYAEIKSQIQTLRFPAMTTKKYKEKVQIIKDFIADL